jgi:arylsulfatase A-like enzyme
MADSAGDRTPNLVFILADDLGWADLACYGSDLHETPHLDQLAAQGVRFTNAYSAAPVCTPTRASLLTGKHPARLRMTIWREASAERGNRELLEPVTCGDLPRTETTLAEILSQAGYYTAHVGKWHLGSAEYYPEAHGFAVNIGGTLWGAPQSFFYPYRGDQYFSDWRYVPDLEPGREGDYLTDRFTDKALEIIEGVGERPFYLNLWYHSVHTPIEGKPELVAKYRGKVVAGSNHVNPDYAAMVASLDENVGRVLQKLVDCGIADRTLVVFCSDNGGFVNLSRLQPGMAVTSNAPLRSGKGSLYEGGIRVPCIVRWPGGTAQGATCHEPIYSCDLLPTVLRALGIDAVLPPQLDGLDISPLFRSPETRLARDTLYFHYPHYYPTTTPVSAVRERDWKLLEYYEQGQVELYNLATDIGESRNLAAEHPDVVSRLQGKLHTWLTEVDAQLPSRREDVQ